MKTTFSFLSTLVISILTTWLGGGCNRTSNEATPQGTCRIEKSVSVSKTPYTVTNNQTTYTYDPQGNLIQTASTQDQHPTSVTTPTQTGTTTVTYTYNSEGYLTALNSQHKTTAVFGTKTTITQISVTSSYSYTNGQLVQTNSRRIGASGVNTNTTELYEYDESGALAKKTTQEKYDYDPAVTKENEIPVSPVGPLYIRTYRKNQLVDYVQKSGTSEFRPLTFQNGLVTKLALPGKQGDFIVTYTYDDQQRLIKRDEVLAGVPTNSFTQTWSNAISSEVALPSFKGWPITAPEYGKGGVLLTKKESYRNTTTGQIDTYSEQNADIQTNSQGFVTNNVILVKHPNFPSEDYTTTETYTYSGCQ